MQPLWKLMKKIFIFTNKLFRVYSLHISQFAIVKWCRSDPAFTEKSGNKLGDFFHDELNLFDSLYEKVLISDKSQE